MEPSTRSWPPISAGTAVVMAAHWPREPGRLRPSRAAVVPMVGPRRIERPGAGRCRKAERVAAEEPPPNVPLLTVPEVAKRLRVSTATVYSLVKEGLLEHSGALTFIQTGLDALAGYLSREGATKG